MNTLTGIFITSFLIAFSGAMAPGPVLTITISESMKRGFWAGPLIILGHGILELILFIAVILGFSQFLTMPFIKGIIGFLGGIALIWFGGEMAIKSFQTQFSLVDAPSKQSLHPILAGIFFSISNPYWTIWWATIGLSYIALSLPFGLKGLTIFYCGHILADLSWYTFISGIIAMGKKNLSGKIYHLIIFVWNFSFCSGNIFFIFRISVFHEIIPNIRYALIYPICFNYTLQFKSLADKTDLLLYKIY